MDKKLKHEIAELLYIAKNIDGLNVDLGNAVYGMIKMELLKYLYYLTSLNEFNDTLLLNVMMNTKVNINI